VETQLYLLAFQALQLVMVEMKPQQLQDGLEQRKLDNLYFMVLMNLFMVQIVHGMN
jgi:hypothetical protein